MVSMDGMVENLKPGMSAEVTIIADETKEPVLTIPIQSVLGSIAMGAERKTYLLDENDQPQLRDITVGTSNDKMVQVIKGINEGDRVVLNPRSLLGDNTELKPGVPGRSRGYDIEEVKTKRAKKGSEGGATGGAPGASGGTPPAVREGDGAPKGLRSQIGKKE